MQYSVKKVSVVAAMLLSAASLFPSAALATPTPATDLGVISGYKGIAENFSAADFDYFYNFKVDVAGAISYVIIATLFKGNGPTISSAAVYAGSFSDIGHLPGVAVLGTSNTLGSTAGDFVFTQTVGTTVMLDPAASYTLVVSGGSNAASAYSGSISLNPVPEPETYALLSAGIGLIGFIVRRRKRT